MTGKVKWGILSTARIGTEKVIPAMQRGKLTEITAIASRNSETAAVAANALSIPHVFGSYDELLASELVDAVYIPLPNHMHTEWAVKAMNAGKHVLCEKPLALTIADIQQMITARDINGVKAGEAFMVNSHPQWSHVRQILRDGKLGRIRAVQGFFSYMNTNANDIRNIPEYGGGGLWDIGCYQIHCTRYLLESEPERVLAAALIDTEFNTDILSSAIMSFGDIHVTFTVSTQTIDSQHLTIYGDKAKLEIRIPFNAPPDRETGIVLGQESLLQQDGEETLFPVIDQYTAQGDAFSEAILNDTAVPVPLEDSLHNTAVILAAFESARKGAPVSPETLL
jgi:predicted dehydrogenase